MLSDALNLPYRDKRNVNSSACALQLSLIVNFYCFDTKIVDTFSSRMNVGETIFRKLEQVSYFLKVRDLTHGNMESIC